MEACHFIPVYLAVYVSESTSINNYKPTAACEAVVEFRSWRDVMMRLVDVLVRRLLSSSLWIRQRVSVLASVLYGGHPANQAPSTSPYVACLD